MTQKLYVFFMLLVLAAFQPVRAALPPLRQLTQINLGAAVEPQYLQNEPLYRDTFTREFNTLIAENAFKFGSLSPARGQYNFTAADYLMDFAAASQMKVRGHTLVWHQQLPAWFTNGSFSRDESIAILREHIAAVVGRYKGRIAEWDVVNEAVDDNQNALRQSLWYQRIGPDYLDIAFRAAQEADPGALLFYNDYSTEGLGGKSDAVYNLVRSLVERGVPVHGVGFQVHTSLAWKPKPEDVAANMARYAALGLKVAITEMDVRVQDTGGVNAANLEAQAQVYRDMLDVCLKAANCTGFSTWGFTDKYSWIPFFTGRADAALIFDQNYQPKPAYTALAQRLSEQAGAPPAPVPDQPAPPTPAPPPDQPPPTPIPGQPTVVVEVQPDGAAVHVALRLVSVANVYGLQTHCAVNPAVLTGTQRTDNGVFTSDSGLFIDRGFDAATGEWVIGASFRRPAAPVSGDALAYTLEYSVSGPGSTPVNCTVLAADPNGRLLTVAVINGSYDGSPQPPVEPTQPPVEPTLPPTSVPTELPPTTVPTTAPGSTIAGTAVYQNSPDSAGIRVELLLEAVPLAEVVTGANGAFQFTDVPAGTYTLRVSAPQHLAYTQAVPTTGEPVMLETITLLAGDTDDSGTVDIADAAFIGANFGLAVPPAPGAADLNRDQQINVVDLVLVGGNFGRTDSQPEP